MVIKDIIKVLNLKIVANIQVNGVTVTYKDLLSHYGDSLVKTVDIITESKSLRKEDLHIALTADNIEELVEKVDIAFDLPNNSTYTAVIINIITKEE